MGRDVAQETIYCILVAIWIPYPYFAPIFPIHFQWDSNSLFANCQVAAIVTTEVCVPPSALLSLVKTAIHHFNSSNVFVGKYRVGFKLNRSLFSFNWSMYTNTTYSIMTYHTILLTSMMYKTKLHSRNLLNQAVTASANLRKVLRLSAWNYCHHALVQPYQTSQNQNLHN